jgi:hypothetical protein
MAATVNWNSDFNTTVTEPVRDESYSKLTREVLFEKYKPDSKFRKDRYNSWNSWSNKIWVSPGIYTRDIDFSILASSSVLDDLESNYNLKSYEAVVLPDLSPEPLYRAEYRVLDKEFVPP